MQRLNRPRVRVLSGRLLVGASAMLMVGLGGCTSTNTASPRQAQAGQSELPVTRVILYQNGVGYFEREGRVSGNELRLQIRPSQINDLLKSLTVIDRTKGRAVSVSLPLEKSGTRVLAELPEQVRDASGVLDVLRVFRGARVRVSGTKGSIGGRIVGVENMQAAASGENVKADWRLTLKTDRNELRVYPVSEIVKIDLDDRTLSVGLDQSLDVSLNEGSWKPISLSVWLAGEPRHDLKASYIVEMPRWKPAYRMVVGAKGDPLLQGWAVVDNVSGEDWNNVKLSLVAGTPMSFIYDLHTPQFTARPDLTPRGRTTAMAPPRIESGVAAPSASVADKVARRHSRSRRASGRSARPMAPKKKVYGAGGGLGGAYDAYEDDMDGEADEAPLEEMLEKEATAQVEGKSVGALFRYDLADKVTVPDRSSTLVAIVNKRVPGREVVLFRPELTRGQVQTHPYRSVMFDNSTGFTLERGPMTIYSGGTFVGEGFLERTQKGNTSFIAYAIDGNISMTSRNGTRREGMRLLKIVDGLIVSEVLEISTATYEVKNRHPKAMTAYVKTSRRTGWTLRNRPAKTIETGKALLVPVSVPANGKASLKIEWVKTIVRREGVNTQLSTNLLQIYMKSGKAPPAVAKKLREVLKIKTRMGEIARDVRRLEKQHRDLSRDQRRVRKNLTMLGKTKGNAALRRELTTKLAVQERALGKLSGRLVKLSEERADREKKLTVVIRTITLTAN